MEMDTVYVACCTTENDSVQVTMNSSVLDDIGAIASLVIAIINVVLIVYIFCKGRQDSKKSDVQSKKFELLQSLILNPKIEKLYTFFDDVHSACDKLKAIDIEDVSGKSTVNQELLDKQAKFRIEFISLFSVVSDGLYREMMRETDKMIDSITTVIFDEGYNLKNEQKYKELIFNPTKECLNKLLSLIYNAPEQYLK